LSRCKCSIAPALLNQEIGSGEDAIPNNFFGQSFEVRPVPLSCGCLLGNDPRDYLVSFSKFYGLAGSEPTL
jgi:hypothetical protein